LKLKVNLQRRHARDYLNGVRVRDSDTFTYWHKNKGWQTGFKSIPEVEKHMARQGKKLIEKNVYIDFNARGKRGERVELDRAVRNYN